MINLTQKIVTGKDEIAEVAAKIGAFPQTDAHINRFLSRWQEAIKDARCCAILQALFDAQAFSPRFVLSARAIGRLAGLHHQVVRRLIKGDKRCRAKLVGLVAWLEGKGRRGTRFWLTPEGRKVAELIANDFQVGKATLTALATDRWRRKMAHYAEMAHKNGTPTENNMQSYDCFNVCSLTAVSALKPVSQKPANGLAARLWQDYGVALKVANDLVARYSPAEIEAAIALRERRNGAIYNGAGFIVYLLSHGFARNYVRARLQARQRAQPPPKPPDEPDWDAAIAALREALAPYGIVVDDEGFADLPNGRLALPPDPDEAIDLLRRHGILRNGQSADQHLAEGDGFSAADQYPADDAFADCDSQNDPSSDRENCLSLADATELADDSDDEGKLSPLKCELCGRLEGEPHPSLQGWQRNDFLCLSELSDAFKQRFGLPECGLLCRGCYVTLGLRLVGTSDPDRNGQSTANANEPALDLTE